MAVKKSKRRVLPSKLRNAPIFNYLVRDRHLVDFANKIDALGIYTFGDFMKKGEDRIFQQVPTENSIRRRVRKLFSAFGI
jgi:hypothetical protein